MNIYFNCFAFYFPKGKAIFSFALDKFWIQYVFFCRCLEHQFPVGTCWNPIERREFSDGLNDEAPVLKRAQFQPATFYRLFGQPAANIWIWLFSMILGICQNFDSMKTVLELFSLLRAEKKKIVVIFKSFTFFHFRKISSLPQSSNKTQIKQNSHCSPNIRARKVPQVWMKSHSNCQHKFDPAICEENPSSVASPTTVEMPHGIDLHSINNWFSSVFDSNFFLQSKKASRNVEVGSELCVGMCACRISITARCGIWTLEKGIELKYLWCLNF